MSNNTPVTASLLIIGNEILSGRTPDENLNFLAKGLNALGIQLREVRVIPDVRQTIVDTLNECRAQFDYLFTTGGIGPTHDDITTECVAAAFGVETFRDQETVDLIASYMQRRGAQGEMNEARMRMATFPVGAELIRNEISAAPGYRIDNVFVLAGVPRIMQAMFEELKSSLKGGEPVKARAVRVALGEGTIADGLSALQDRFPDVDIGSYPAMRKAGFGVSVVLRGTDTARIDEAFDALDTVLRDLGGEPVEENADDAEGDGTA